MAEVRRILSGETVKYSGPFDLAGLRGEIDDWFDRFDYDADIVMDEEKVFQDHKECTVVWDCERDMSDYATVKLEVKLVLDDLKDVTIKADGKDITCKDADIEFIIDGWINTDTEGRYEGRPLLYFLRYVGEHMLYKNYIDEYEEMLHEQCKDLKREVNRYLNKEIQV